MDIVTFGRTIKQKYPQYANMDDEVLGNLMLQKYPQYKTKITGAQKTVEEQQKAINLEKSKIELEKAKKEQVPSKPLSSYLPQTTPTTQPIATPTTVSTPTTKTVKPPIEGAFEDVEPQRPQAESLLGKAGQFAKGVGDFLMPQTMKMYGQAFDAISKGKQIADDPNIAPEQKQKMILDLMQQTTSEQDKRKLKATLELASYAVPAGKGITGLMKMGAAAGALRGASEGETALPDVGNILAGTASGAIAGGVLGVGGKALSGAGKLIKWGKEGLEDMAVKSIGKASPSAFVDAVQSHGIDLNKLITKYFPRNADYDVVLGEINKRGTGGILKQGLSEAEAKIQEHISIAGASQKFPIQPFVKEMLREVRSLKKVPGNEKVAQGLAEFVDATGKLYKNGITAKRLMEIKRIADSKFGEAVVNEQTGSVAAQGQKMLANWSRNTLKTVYPEIADALDAQTEIYTLRPVLEKARGIMKTQGSLIRTGANVNLNPITWIEAALYSPKVASKFIPKEKTVSPIMSSAGAVLPQIGKGTQIAGTQLGATVGARSLEPGVQKKADSYQGEYQPAPGEEIQKDIKHEDILPQVGPSIQELRIGYEQALVAGDDKAADRLKGMIDMREKAEKATKDAKTPTTLDRFIDDLEDLYFPPEMGSKGLSAGESTVGLPGIVTRGGVETGKLLNQDYVDKLAAYKNMRIIVLGMVNKARMAGTLQPSELATLLEETPNEYTSTRTAKAWFNNARKILRGVDISKQSPAIVTEY